MMYTASNPSEGLSAYTYEVLNMAIRRISTSLPEHIYQYLKRNNLPFNHMIMLGMQSAKGNPQLIERLRGQESEMNQLKKAVWRLQREIQTKQSKRG